MQRRSFLKKAGVGLAAGAVAAPAIGQGRQPEVKWRLARAGEEPRYTLRCLRADSKRVASAPNGKFPDPAFAAGEIRPRAAGSRRGAKCDRCSAATTAPYYFFGKDPTFAFACAIPFGLNARQQNRDVSRRRARADARVHEG